MERYDQVQIAIITSILEYSLLLILVSMSLAEASSTNPTTVSCIVISSIVAVFMPGSISTHLQQVHFLISTCAPLIKRIHQIHGIVFRMYSSSSDGGCSESTSASVRHCRAGFTGTAGTAIAIPVFKGGGWGGEKGYSWDSNLATRLTRAYR